MPRIASRSMAIVAAFCVAAIVTACSATTAAAPEATDSAATGMIPDGVYRHELSVEELVDAGAIPPEARSNSGVLTLTVADGRFTYHQQGGATPDCTGTLSEVDGKVRFSEDQPPMCSEPVDSQYFDVAWTIEDGELVLSDLTLPAPDVTGFQVLLASVYTSKPWTIID